MMNCEFGVPYSEYVRGTKFEKMFFRQPEDHRDEYGKTIICCHPNSPTIRYCGEDDRCKCEYVISIGKCPLGKVSTT